MISRIFPALFLLFFSVYSFSQDDDFLNASTIPLELKVNANAVIRLDSEKMEISSLKSLRRKYHRIITVLNERGLSDINAHLGYDKSININTLRAVIYDGDGNEIKKFKKSDFEDVSSVSDFSLYEDNRVKYLRYTPKEYPFTVDFYFETSNFNTAYLSTWTPLESYYISTERSIYEIVYDSEIGLNIKESNFEGYEIKNISSEGKLSYIASNIKAIKWEQHSPLFKYLVPHLYVNPRRFHYEGYLGETSNWRDLGKWMYDELLVGRSEVSGETKQKILDLTRGIENPIERAKIVYDFVQNQTRYISVQEGIGGIQPISALMVDEVKYGDCKGLTNYTKALMDVVGVESNYARVYGSQDNIVDVDSTFVSFVGQTNHVILNIPNNLENIWLECTSQTVPFGYIAGFTDDRNVFVITPKGGKIVHTKEYKTEDNLQLTKANVLIDKEGNASGNVDIQSSGYQYSFHHGIESKTQKDQKLHYKEYWDSINNLSIEDIELINDKDKILYTEKVKVLVKDYGSKSGDRLLIEPNMFNKVTSIPARYSDRKQDFEVDRGFTDKDEFVIEIVPELSVEAMPKPVLIETKFGSYSMSIEKNTDNQLTYRRTYILNKGYYDKSEYADFRKFKRNVVKHDKAKIVLITKT